MIDFKGNPFFLNDEQIQWVKDTLASMTLEEKAAHVFCPVGNKHDDATIEHMVRDIKVGAVMYRPARAEQVRETHKKIQEMAKIPLLLAANTEAGGNGIMSEGTGFGMAMSVAATGDPEDAYRMGKVACAEAAAVGLNWAFAPVVDIDMDFHNPITNQRTFGSDPDRVIACASAYMRAADEEHVAVSIKHFPGDGSDERDQHILTSINRLSCEEWMNTYGKVYGTLIERGAKAVMVGHIAQPAWVKALKPGATNRERLLPATLSPELMTGLLRGKLGFNGLITTDSTLMIGFCAAMPRHLAVPTAIAAGADIFLFNKNLDEDYSFVLEGLKNGILTEARLDEAVMRILATKASLGLADRQKNGTLVPPVEAMATVGCETFKKWSFDVADKSVTLVKDTQSLLPLDPKKQKRLCLTVIQRNMSPNHGVVLAWKELFEKEGFEVTVRNRRTSLNITADPATFDADQQVLWKEMKRTVTEMRDTYDLHVYIANMQNASNFTTLRLNWNIVAGLGDDAPWMASEMPTMLISTGSPYHMYDAPMIPTMINAYANNDAIRAAIMEKVMGRSEFYGKSPVDAFCGDEYLRMAADPDGIN